MGSPAQRVKAEARDARPPITVEPSALESTATGAVGLAHFKLDEPHPLVLDGPGYDYIHGSTLLERVPRKAQALELSQEILNPGLTDPNFLVLRERRRILAQWVEHLPKSDLAVLDVGGRLQPYRPLLADRLGSYTAIDPVFEGLLDVAAIGEALPFRSEAFDLAVCTQALNYSADPFGAMAEIHRVLRPGGALFLSVPAIFPRYADQRWRFMPEGLEVLLRAFSTRRIEPEGRSIAGLFRLFNLFVDTMFLDGSKKGWRARRLISSAVFPVMNLAGLTLDVFSGANTRFTTNYSCLALK